MSAQPQFLDLDFNRYSPCLEFIDKKAGVKAALGLIGVLPVRMQPVVDRHDSLLLSVQDAGIGQDLLDQAFRTLEEDCARRGVDIIIARSTRPFDKLWYVFGDLAGLFDALESERVSLPFDSMLYEDLSSAAEKLKTR